MPTREVKALLGYREAWGRRRNLLFIGAGLKAAICVGRRVRESGPAAQLQVLRPANPLRAAQPLTDPPSRLSWFMIQVSRAFHGRQACLFESIVLATALRAMRYDARLLLGHAHAAELTAAPMHAWVEIDGVSVRRRDVEPRVHYTIVAAY